MLFTGSPKSQYYITNMQGLAKMKIQEIYTMCDDCKFQSDRTMAKIIFYHFGEKSIDEIKKYAGELALNKRDLDNFKLSDANTIILRKLCLLIGCIRDEGWEVL